MANEHYGNKLVVKLPTIARVEEFAPTGKMIQALSVYLLAMDKDKSLSGCQAAIEAGCSNKLWYKWLKRPHFIDWWNAAVAEYHKSTGLSDIYGDIFKFARRAVNHADRKLYLERFDKDYKPQHAEEHRFPGIMPPDEIETRAERSRARARQFAAKNVESKEVESSNSTTPHSQDEPETKDSQSENETIQGNADPPPPLSEGAR